ncbi:hypothetical protein ABPG72_014652 [Tetrahymena utriculariae]
MSFALKYMLEENQSPPSKYGIKIKLNQLKILRKFQLHHQLIKQNLNYIQECSLTYLQLINNKLVKQILIKGFQAVILTKQNTKITIIINKRVINNSNNKYFHFKSIQISYVNTYVQLNQLLISNSSDNTYNFFLEIYQIIKAQQAINILQKKLNKPEKTQQTRKNQIIKIKNNNFLNFCNKCFIFQSFLQSRVKKSFCLCSKYILFWNILFKQQLIIEETKKAANKFGQQLKCFQK